MDIVKYTHRKPRPVPPDRVGDVMTRQVVAVRREAPLGEVVRMLLDRDFCALPVVDGEQRLVGIITNRDLVERGGLSRRVELLRTPQLRRDRMPDHQLWPFDATARIANR